MSWQVKYENKQVLKKIAKLGTINANRVLTFLRNIDGCKNPKAQGKALKGDKKELWRYRVGPIRIITKLDYTKKVILVGSVVARKEAY